MTATERDRADFFLQLLADYTLLNELSTGALNMHCLHKVGIKYGLRLEDAYRSRHLPPGENLSPEEFAELAHGFIRRLGGEYEVQSCRRTKIVLCCRSCVFGLMTLKVPGLCNIMTGVLGGIAARNFPYCKVTVEKQPDGAPYPDLCRLVFHLSETPEAGAAEGRVFSHNPASYLLTREEILALDETMLSGGYLYSKFENGIKNLLSVHREMESEYDHLRNEIFSDLKLGVIITDKECRVTYLNEAAGKLLTAADSTPLPLAPFLALMAGTLTSGTRLSQQELAVDSDDGTRYFSVNATPFRRESGEISGTIGVFQDFTAKKLLELEMLQMEKFSLVAELAAGIAHEIRNPITSLRGFLQLLKTEFSPGSKGHEYSELMIQEIDRVNSIIKEFLLLTRPAAPDLRETDLHQVLEDICLLVESKSLLENVSLEKNYLSGPLPVTGDPDQLKQVFLNLATNAIQAMPEGGTLSISTAVDNDKIYIKFRDTGCGINPSEREKIFNPFYTTKEQGTGLGLAVSYRIMAAHNGRILVDSLPGRGSTFTVELPLAGNR